MAIYGKQQPLMWLMPKAVYHPYNVPVEKTYIKTLLLALRLFFLQLKQCWKQHKWFPYLCIFLYLCWIIRRNNFFKVKFIRMHVDLEVKYAKRQSYEVTHPQHEVWWRVTISEIIRKWMLTSLVIMVRVLSLLCPNLTHLVLTCYY